ncbi:MAG: response regulator [Fluviicoccus sp.]|uniref:response regulator n=1 Tax=Fluviicoccus sp. TaxID=2003552 RepID=UPI00271DCB7E|nr:HD domain-containing phosphohydrolase [Fluviicoccus sp.]MDO8331361.1 response regulator [Fluviicoccus sp.]
MNKRESATILIVDDEPRNIRLLEALLHLEGYTTRDAASGEEALASIKQQAPDLILLDIMMPGMTGYQVASALKSDPVTANIPIIMVTAQTDREARLAGLNAGAEEFLTKPVDRAELWVRVRNLLRLKEYGDFLANHNRILNEQVTLRTAQLEEAYRDTVFTLVRAAERKDEETGHHVRRISHYCQVLAEAMNLPLDFSTAIFHASPMHDIGKIGIPDHILLKPGAFTPEEWAVMKTHCALGEGILSSGTSPYTQMGAEIALNHHEHWDGSGYPNGLEGTAIPLAARIMQICDVYDALRSQRPYKPPFDHERTVGIITQGDGRTRPTHFDPAVLTAFTAQADRFAAIYDHFVTQEQSRPDSLQGSMA